MNDADKKIRKLARKDDFSLPPDADRSIESTLDSLSEQPPRHRRGAGIAAAAVLAALMLFVLLPNLDARIAHAMSEVPVLGEIVRVITFRDYSYSDELHEAEVERPLIEAEEDSLADSAEDINAEVKALTQAAIDRFKADLRMDGKSPSSLLVDYEVTENSETWFTLRLTVFRAAGSSMTENRYYHIDKRTGKCVRLSDLFEDEGYIDAISADILSQMAERSEQEGEIFFISDSLEYAESFTCIDADEDFYFEDGRLVIAFDKYEVAPGSMGCPSFAIDRAVYERYLKEEYR